MTDIEEIKAKLQRELKPKRFVHSLNVMEESARLAQVYGADREKAVLAGLLHDCARDIRGEEVFRLCREFGIMMDEVSSRQPELLHGPLGCHLAARDYGVRNEEVLKAIRYHTTGHENMNLLEKVVFLADYTEPGRSFPGVLEIRRAAEENIDSALLAAMDSTIRFVIEKGALLHHETINARNYILKDMDRKQQNSLRL